MEQTNYPVPQTTPATDQKEMIALLKRQNELLESLQKNTIYAMRREDEQHNTVVMRVIDVNMSIGSMISFMFKWLVASIVVALIISVIVTVIGFLLTLVGVGVGGLGILGGLLGQ